jgi:hypothetical protein
VTNTQAKVDANGNVLTKLKTGTAVTNTAANPVPVGDGSGPLTVDGSVSLADKTVRPVPEVFQTGGTLNFSTVTCTSSVFANVPSGRTLVLTTWRRAR